MFDYIKDHAIKNVWCTPDQDLQVIIEPARLTLPTGAFISFKVLNKKIDLPDFSSYWHVYQIGQLHPLIVGLFPIDNKWISFDQACNNQKTICDIYLNSGIQLPRFNTFYMYTNEKNLIVAVRKNNKIPFDFLNDKVFLRVYNNEYYNSNRSDALVDTIHVEGIKPTSTIEILNFQIKYNSYLSKPGLTYAFVNGYKVKDINLITLSIGDFAEFVYDSSINSTIDFKINDLKTFESILDNKIKYILHYLGTDDTIQYQDDIDFFIIDKANTIKEKGVYFHKNNKDSIRMLTHRDYSIVTAYVLGYVNTLQKTYTDLDVINPNDLTIRLHIRKSGYLRPIIFEHNRIKELYKMSDDHIVNAMVGIDSLVTVWDAANLENSNYTKIMQSKYTEITNEMVQYGYGYNSVSRIIGDTPFKTRLESFRQVIDVPYGLQSSSTVYEYNENGLLIGYYPHYNGSKYASVNNNARLIEIISGVGSLFLDDVFGIDNVPVPLDSSYRVYMCYMVGGVPNNIWSDVTGTDSYFLQNNKIKWVDQNIDPYIRVRSNHTFLSYELNLQANIGLIKFDIDNIENREGITAERVMQVPMGELDIFLNGKSLIKGLDYNVNFPEVVIFNKEYLINPLTDFQNIHIRFTGFCDKDLNLTHVDDYGFIKHGFLSNNNKFDIRDDKVLRIVLDGQLKTRDDVLFSEEHSGVSILNVTNGRPYSIRDIVVPLKGLTKEDTYTLREKSMLVDMEVADYLTLKIPQPERPALSAIAGRYQVFSPFICKIIYDLNIGILNNPLILNNFSDNTVNEICKPYEYLLEFDPINSKNSVDSNFVAIHPHNLFTVIQLDFFNYRFIERVIKLYAKGLVTLSPFLNIKPVIS